MIDFIETLNCGLNNPVVELEIINFYVHFSPLILQVGEIIIHIFELLGH